MKPRRQPESVLGPQEQDVVVLAADVLDAALRRCAIDPNVEDALVIVRDTLSRWADGRLESVEAQDSLVQVFSALRQMPKLAGPGAFDWAFGHRPQRY